jgi:hypothetical protein
MSGVPATSRIVRRPRYTFHHEDGPPDDIGPAKLWPEAIEPARIVEYRGFKLRRTDANHGYFWHVVDNTAPELDGSFTKLPAAHYAIDNFLNRERKLENDGTREQRH